MTIALDSRWQLRLGGLAASTADGLDGDAHTRSLELYQAAVRHLTEYKTEISDALHGAIAGCITEERDAAALVALRRALFKVDAEAVGRRLMKLSPADSEMFFDALGEHADAASDWLAHEQFHAESFADTLADQRSRLRESVDDDAFLRGISISSPDLIPEIQRYGRDLDEKGRVDKRGKRVERSLMSYLLRASAKTTPFSWLGPVCFPHPEFDVRESVAPATANQPTTARSRWSVYPLAHVLSVLPEHPELIAGFEVHSSPYLRKAEDLVLVDRATWTFDEVDSRDDYAACVESQVRLDAHGVLALIDELLARHGGTLTWGRLTHDLTAETGLSPERATELVQSMARLGVIVAPALSIDAVDDSTFERTLRELSCGSQKAAELATALRDYRDAALVLAELHDASGRAQLVRDLRVAVADIYQRVGIATQPPRSVVYEDVVLHDADTSPHSRINLAASAAEALVQWVDLLDESHTKRDLLNGYYQHTVNAGESVDDVAEFLRGLDADLLESFEGYDVSGVDDADLESDPWLRWGGAWKREKARRELIRELELQQTALPIAELDATRLFETPAVDLTSAVRRISPDLPSLDAPYRHMNLLLQHDAATGLVVMNDCFGGVGFPISRFSHVLREQATALTHDVERVAADAGVRLVEISGGTVFSNLNLHDAVLSSRLQVPGDPVRDLSSHVSLSSLEVRWSDRYGHAVLAERGSSTIVYPEYTGYLVPRATPRLHQTLGLFAPSATISTKPADLLQATPNPGHVLARPRMTVGEVVVVRAALIIRADELPSADPLEGAGNIEWQRFWASLALPRRAYLRVLSEGAGRRPKPFFFDIALVLCLSNLHSQVRQHGGAMTVEITEVLPGPSEASPDPHATVRVAEAMVGVSLVADSSKEL